VDWVPTVSDAGAERGGYLPERARRLLTLTVALLLLAAVSGTLYVATTDFETGETYSEFYVLNENGTAAGYPTNLTTGEERTVLLGIGNHENERVTYRMEVAWNDTTVESREVTVEADRTEEFVVAVSAPDTPGNYRLDFLLYRTTESTEPYKNVYLNVEVRRA
jgi:uncharacterized membrane protein